MSHHLNIYILWWDGLGYTKYQKRLNLKGFRRFFFCKKVSKIDLYPLAFWH